MTNSYVDITAEINRGILKLRQGAPDAMAGFTADRNIPIGNCGDHAIVLHDWHHSEVTVAHLLRGFHDCCVGADYQIRADEERTNQSSANYRDLLQHFVPGTSEMRAHPTPAGCQTRRASWQRGEK